MAYILSPPILLLGVKGRCNCASVQQNTKMETLVIQPQDKEERSPGARNHQGTCKEKGTKESDTTKSTNIPRVRVLLWHSMLRSQHCHCSGLGHCFGIGLIPGKGTSTCYRLGQKKKKKSLLGSPKNYAYTIRFPNLPLGGTHAEQTETKGLKITHWHFSAHQVGRNL